MPTISQLPDASSVSSADELPISQGGTARAVSVGTLLASVQPVITVDPSCLLGRASLGPGGPEQVDVGIGMNLFSGTLAADGLDHAAFPLVSTLPLGSDLVISNQGSPMLMPASLLRGLFAAGQNVAIDPNGTISAAGAAASAGPVESGSSIGALHVVSELSSQDLVAISQSGSDCAITYGNFLDGITIDQAQPAGPAGDSDATWVAQGSNVMASQTFGAIWVWIASKLPTYRVPVIEVTANTNLDTTVHNGRLLICSQPITLTPLTTNMGNGFGCSVINASTGSVTLGPGFVSSNGSQVLMPWQTATLSCLTYSAGTIAFAAMPAATTVVSPPSQVSSLATSGLTSSTITVSWQPPSSGGVVSSYIVQYRLTGTTSWSSSPLVVGATTYQLTALQAATSYDVVVQAQNAAGAGAASPILTVVTSADTQTTVPQVTGLVASPTSSSVLQLNWSAQAGSSAATSFTVQYRVTGSTSWASSITGVSGSGTAVTGLQAGTSYDFAVAGVNAAGTGPASSIVSAETLAAAQSVNSITWNWIPSGNYTAGTSAIPVNAHISPPTAPVQFGFSLSAITRPTSWVAAILVNTDLWGAYVPTPATAGTWYVWGEGLDGSAPTVSTSSFLVQ
jgi:hypothetical protein